MGTSQNDIAAALGLSPGRVSQMKKAGMPVGSLDAARAWYRANTVGRPQTPSRPVSKPRPPRSDDDDGQAAKKVELETLAEARTRREISEANQAEMAEAEQRGDMVRASAFLGAQEKKANMVREAILQLPAQMAPVVAAEGDVAKCQDVLMDACLSILARISA